jgi:hypothetical protein
MKTWGSWEIIRHQVAICGRVVNDRGERVCGVKVNIVLMPKVFLTRVSLAASATEKKWDERVDRTMTREDGIFYFLDLPAGQYTLSFDTRSDSPDEKKMAVIWNILPAIRDKTKENIITPYKLMPLVPFIISGDNVVEYKVKGQ